MKEHFFGLTKKEHLSTVSVTLKNTDVCPIRIRHARIIKRNDIEHEIKFFYQEQHFVINFRANKKYLFVTTLFPLKGIRSCIEHDGSMVEKINLGYFNKQEILLTAEGDMMLSFLINDLINTTELALSNPNIIFGLYQLIREKLEKDLPSIKKNRIRGRLINNSPYTSLLADSVRKKYYFSYNGTNMFLSFQAIIENHPELFTALMN